MLDRLYILIAIAAVSAILWGAFRLWRSIRLRKLREQSLFGELIPPGKPAVVAFWAPYCRDCHTLQEPALNRLEHDLDDRITVKSLSALDYPELVDQLGILTVPSTVVLDRNGSVRHLNLGYASDTKLREQLTAG